jgi:hypothetical protein
VSDLIAAGSAHKTLLDPLFALYNLLTAAFSVGLLKKMRIDNLSGKGMGMAGALFLLVEGLVGFVTLFFPEDVGGMGASISFIGTMHIILAGLSSLTSMLSILFIGLWFWKNPHLRRFGIYSFTSLALVFVSGGLAAVSISTGSALSGLMERITIGGFLQWILVIAWFMYSSDTMTESPKK